MKLKREHYLLTGLGLTLFAVAMAMLISIFTTENAPPALLPTPTIEPTPSQSNPRVPIRYDKTSFDKLVDKVENKQQLSDSDIAARTSILSRLPTGKKSGILYSTPTIIIDYTSGVDLFQVEILTTDIASAKEEGAGWFRNQGVSQQGICDLPVDFYLNWQIASELRGQNITFNPLAEGC